MKLDTNRIRESMTVIFLEHFIYIYCCSKMECNNLLQNHPLENIAAYRGSLELCAHPQSVKYDNKNPILPNAIIQFTLLRIL